MIRMVTKRLYINNQPTMYLISDDGRVFSEISNKYLKPFKTKQGYCLVDISHDGKTYTRQLHRLVALTFIPNPLKLETVNHKNGNKECNAVWNLEWMTRLDNVRHAWKTGLAKPRYGTDNPANVYTEDQIHAVCKLLEIGELNNKRIAEKCDVNVTLIRDIKFRGKWKKISKLYDIPTVPAGLKDRRDDIIKLIDEGLSNREIITKLDLPMSKLRHVSYVRLRHNKEIMRNSLND